MFSSRSQCWTLSTKARLPKWAFPKHAKCANFNAVNLLLLQAARERAVAIGNKPQKSLEEELEVSIYTDAVLLMTNCNFSTHIVNNKLWDIGPIDQRLNARGQILWIERCLQWYVLTRAFFRTCSSMKFSPTWLPSNRRTWLAPQSSLFGTFTIDSVPFSCNSVQDIQKMIDLETYQNKPVPRSEQWNNSWYCYKHERRLCFTAASASSLWVSW